MPALYQYNREDQPHQGDQERMIFKNQNIGKEVTVDIDTYFYYFTRPESEWPEGEKQGITQKTIRERLARLQPMINYEPVITRYRRSSNDHVHVKMTFLSELTVLDAFMIRAWMLDDQTRLSLDLARYLLTGSLHEMNRCFDEKATVDGTKKAGPWISLMVKRDQYSGIAHEYYREYLKRWNKQTPLITASFDSISSTDQGSVPDTINPADKKNPACRNSPGTAGDP
jgi:hypothetical protein